MTLLRLRIDEARPLAPAGSACAGTDEDGRPWTWIDAREPSPAAGELAEIDPAQVLRGAEGDNDALLEALQRWPAWRLLALAGLEVGSRLLVIGDGPLASQVLALAARRGCQWRAAWGASATDVEHRLPASVDAGRALAALPARPDAVIAPEADAEALRRATRVCADRGTVVVAGTGRADMGFYPDVHRRGLKLVLAAVRNDARGEAWSRFVRVLRHEGLLAAQNS